MAKVAGVKIGDTIYYFQDLDAESAISDLEGVLHFIGSTSTDLSDGSTVNVLTPRSTGSLKKITGFVNGDLVIDFGGEFFVRFGQYWRAADNVVSSSVIAGIYDAIAKCVPVDQLVEFTDEQKGIARRNIDAAALNDLHPLVSTATSQSFTDEEKAQGRANIGAASQEDINDKIEEIEEDLQDYARKDGSYEQMIVGGAMNLAGQTVEVNSEMYHPTGVNHASGVAEVRGIKGNTVAWNQLAHELSSDYWRANKSTISFSSNAASFTATARYGGILPAMNSARPKIIQGHKYLFFCRVKTTSAHVGLSIQLTLGNTSYTNAEARTDWQTIKLIQTCTSTGLAQISIQDNRESGWDENQAKDVMLIDLTLIYGAGNEPSTPEQFEADYFKWFGKPLTCEDYDEGSLRSVNMAAYKTVGFNQWDEEWEVGGYDDNGQKVHIANVIRSVNSIKVMPNTEYFISTFGRVMAYQEDNTCLGRLAFTESGSGYKFTTPSNCYYIRFNTSVNYGNTYNHDICINISNAEKNGEYEPYEVHNYPMPVTTMKGKLNGEGASVVVFPDGMKSAGDVHDEIFISGGKTYGIKRVGSVDLGSLTWTKQNSSAFSGGYFFKVTIPNIVGHNDVNDCVNSKYIYTIVGNPLEKTFGRYGKDLHIYNTSYSDAATFKAAMNGVMLYYELETPEIYEIDDFKLPQNILVDSDGTEEVLNAQGKENDSVAPYIDMIYSINAVGALNNLPQGYISEKSMDNFLARLSSAMGGTWTKTWNSTLKEWEFSFTPSANTNSLTPNNEEA